MWTVYLLLLGKLSPKHKRNFKQVNDGMFVFLVSSFIHDFHSHSSAIIKVFMLASRQDSTVVCSQQMVKLDISLLIEAKRGHIFTFLDCSMFAVTSMNSLLSTSGFDQDFWSLRFLDNF